MRSAFHLDSPIVRNLRRGDVVNIQFANEAVPSRALITDIFADGVEVTYAQSNSMQRVPLEVVHQRVVLPWKPSDLCDYFIVFCRRIRDTEEYLEDLRVRRALVSRILQLHAHLSAVGSRRTSVYYMRFLNIP